MHDRYSLLAIIPARGGSKGLPNKNILNCAGKPLIVWTIETACAVSILDEVCVSTDNEQIANIARSAGANVPFLRPKEIATDSASLVDVVRHAWGNLKDPNGKLYDYVVVLQPTSPLRTKAHLEFAINHYFDTRRSDNDTLASVYPVSEKFGWLMQKSNDSPGYIDFCFDIRASSAQRQSLAPYYMPNGAIFIVPGFALANGFYTDYTIPFIMDAVDSLDIDSRAEFDHAAKILQERLSKSDNIFGSRNCG